MRTPCFFAQIQKESATKMRLYAFSLGKGSLKKGYKERCMYDGKSKPRLNHNCVLWGKKSNSRCPVSCWNTVPKSKSERLIEAERRAIARMLRERAN